MVVARRATSQRASLRVLRKGIPGVASVRNEAAARGGMDAETIDVGRQRAELELRTRDRAVTAEDFEFLAGEATPRVARVRCGLPQDGRAIPVYVLPAVPDRFPEPARALDFDDLTPEKEMLAEVCAYLDERSMLGTSVDVQPVRLRGIQVAVDARVEKFADPLRVEHEIKRALYRYVNPFGGSLGGRPGGVGLRPRRHRGRAARGRAYGSARQARLAASDLRVRSGEPRGAARMRPARRSSSAGTSSSAPETTPSAAAVTESAPPTASARRYLRDGVPAVYRENDFAMEFLHGLEEVLDPIVAFLDALPAHIDVTLAPPEFVTLVGKWLGIDPEGRWEGLLGSDEFRRRALVSRATVIARRRGTGASLQRVLDLLFPDLGLRVRDFGRSTFSAEPRDPPAADASFEVISTVEPARRRRAAVDQVVEQLRPVHVTYKGLRVEEARG